MSDLLRYWPALLWVLGFVEFHAAVVLAPGSMPPGLSVALALIVLGVACWTLRGRVAAHLRGLAGELRGAPLPCAAAVALAAAMFVVAAAAARLPPHLPQEWDAINYHMALPRQHLLAGTFAHLPWSTADLWPLPLQYGFAPAWFMLGTFHKLPQLVASLWAFGILLALGRRLAPGGHRGWVPAVAVFTTHGVMVQLGTAMLDLTNLYLLLACLHAARNRRIFWTALHLGLWVAAKPTHPPQALAGSLIVGLWVLLAARDRWVAAWPWLRRVLALGGALSFVLLLRSTLVGLDRAGTPLFPFLTCAVADAACCHGAAGEALRVAAEMHFENRDAYGNGRGLLAFLKHLYRLSVPTGAGGSPVNNEYDYPLGLAWLLLVVFVAAEVPGWIRTRHVPVEGILAFSLWAMWWVGTQQTRFLFGVVALGLLATVRAQSRSNGWVVSCLLLASAGFSFVSQLRALGPTLLTPPSRLQAQLEQRYGARESGGVASDVATLYLSVPVEQVIPATPPWTLPVEPRDSRR